MGENSPASPVAVRYSWYVGSTKRCFAQMVYFECHTRRGTAYLRKGMQIKKIHLQKAFNSCHNLNCRCVHTTALL